MLKIKEQGVERSKKQNTLKKKKEEEEERYGIKKGMRGQVT